jgi:hypothetical protein
MNVSFGLFGGLGASLAGAFFGVLIGIVSLVLIVGAAAIAGSNFPRLRRFWLGGILGALMAAFGGAGLHIVYSAIMSASSPSGKEVTEYKLQQVTDENMRLALENMQKQAEIERLERMKIQVDSASPILKLGLLAVTMTSNDFLRKPVDSKTGEEGIPFFKRGVVEDTEYLGLQQVTMDVNLGIDLKQVKVEERDNVLYVSGIKSESHGISNRDTKWLMKEIRRKRTVSGKQESYVVDNSDTRLTDLVLAQERGLDKRLNQGLEFVEHDKTIRRFAEGYIELLLSPLQKKIVFLEQGEESGEPVPLQQFMEQHNKSIDHQIRQHKTK